MKLSARNKLKGTVTKITKGEIGSIVEIQLDAAPVISAVITNDGVEDLELAEGSPACAVIKSSNVMVGVCQDGTGCGCQTGE